jgi:hypothetical protein
MSLLVLFGLLYGSYWLCHNDHRRTCTPRPRKKGNDRNTSRRHGADDDGEGKEEEEE